MRRSSRTRLITLLSSLVILVAMGLTALHLIEPRDYRSDDSFTLQRPPTQQSAAEAGNSPRLPKQLRQRLRRALEEKQRNGLQPVPYAQPGVVETNPIKPETDVVRVGIYVENNYNVDLSGPTFSSNGYYWLRWSPRLQERLEALDLSATSMIEFANQVDTWDSNIRPFSKDPQRFPNGDYYQIYEYSGRFFIGNVNLRSYPFYTLKLPINMEANDQTNAFTFPYLRLIPDIASSGIGRFAWVNGHITRGWSMDEYRHHYAGNFGWDANGIPDEVSYSQVILSVDYSRSPKASFWSLFQPLIVVLAVVLLSPTLSSAFWDGRIAIPSTAILTLVFMQSGYKAQIPDLPYLTFIDKVYVISYVICLACFALFVWSANRLEGVTTEQEKLMVVAAINRIDSRFQLFSLFFLTLGIIACWHINLA